ncbi:MAG: hypothetical protein U5K53_09760 [Halanaerobiales bacterium]|nr:hypothetical protein [Halanaerobiales bacterium]
MQILPKSIVNTEVNSGNFIIDDKNNNYYLIDWEKPLITTPLQDLSHFSVPTTTLWKTDYRMNEKDRSDFINTYCKKRKLLNHFEDIKKALNTFDKYSVMRGLSWSAMAWIKYQKEDRLLKNEDTFKKMDSYLKIDFIKDIFNDIFEMH